MYLICIQSNEINLALAQVYKWVWWHIIKDELHPQNSLESVRHIKLCCNPSKNLLTIRSLICNHSEISVELQRTPKHWKRDRPTCPDIISVDFAVLGRKAHCLTPACKFRAPALQWTRQTVYRKLCSTHALSVECKWVSMRCVVSVPCTDLVCFTAWNCESHEALRSLVHWL